MEMKIEEKVKAVKQLSQKNKVDDLPIIIFHLGNQDYVRLCLQQAVKHNKTVILLTNIDTFKYLPITVVNIEEYSRYLEPLKKLYKHYSTNSAQIEFLCIFRWFVAYEYMKRNGITRAFLCDSDVLIYENLTDINNRFLYKYDYMLCSSISKDLTGGQSVWNLDVLEQFILFSIRFYQVQIPNIEAWHRTYRSAGGICDMTLLYYFAHRGKTNKFVGLQLPEQPTIENDLTQIFKDDDDDAKGEPMTFDLHLATFGNHLYPEQYERHEATNNKHIKFRDGKPYCFNKRLGTDVRFILLHFQGRNKAVMNEYFMKSS